MKPSYSIRELAEILDQDVYTVANGLVAADIPTFHNGVKVDLARYDCFRPSYNGENIFVLSGGKPSPNPNTIVVSTAALPDVWLQSIRNTPLIDGDHGSADHVSKKLSILNRAALVFWANADRGERDTHREQSDVVKWLIDQGFSQITAKSGATIIRPDWAPTGRKPKE